MIASALIHGFALVSLGLGTWQASVPQGDNLAVYLAVPSAVPEHAVAGDASSGEKTVPESAQSGPGFVVQAKARIVKPQPAVEMIGSFEDPVPGPSQFEEKQMSQRHEGGLTEPGQSAALLSQEPIDPDKKDPDPDPERWNMAAPDNVSPEMVDHGGPKDLPDHGPSAFANIMRSASTYAKAHRPAMADKRITGHQPPLLAFAGDPATLGIVLPDAPGPERVEAGIISLPEPVYPVWSRKRGEEGRVVIQVEISAEGQVLKVQVADSSSYARLDRAALEAVRKAAFRPATDAGHPVGSITKVAYKFQLERR